MKKYLTLLFFFHFTVKGFAQANYYVSPLGNNNNNGLIATPWKTIQYGINNLHVNDTLNLLDGTYNEKITISQSNICIRNYNGGRPILNGTGLTQQVAMLQITDRSNVTIDGLEIANNIQLDAQGILVEGNCQNITIQHCNIHDIHFSADPNAAVNSSKNAQGIIVYGTDATNSISNLKIHGNKLYNCRLGYSEGIAVNGNVSNFEVTGNEVYDLTNIGIDAIGHEGTSSSAATDQARNGLIKNNKVYRCLSAYATSGGIYVDGAKNIVIENNTAYHNGYGIEIGCEGIGKTTDSIIVRNNILYDNQICALALGGYDYPSGSGKVTNSSFRNNTCFKNDFNGEGTGELYLSYSENSVIENNIFYCSPQNILAYAELSQPALKFNYNVFFSDNDPLQMEVQWNGSNYASFAAFAAGTSTNTNSIVNNPLFVNPVISTPDFHINPLSPAREGGNPLFLPAITERDMDNELRLSGIVDCGADEYYAATTDYVFTGNGNWDIAANWLNGLIPPAALTGNQRIIINPVVNGECILNVIQHITNGAQFIISSGKKMKILGGFTINHS